MNRPFAALAAGLMFVLAAQTAAAQPAAPAPAASAPVVAGLDGDWSGTLDAGAAGKLRLIFHIKTDAHGTSATIDSLDQGADGIPVSSISRDGQKVRIELEVVQGAFDGALDAGGQTLTGQWSQGGAMLPLVLTRKAAP